MDGKSSNIFFTPCEERNFVLLVEDQKLYVSKETLAIYSPVFKKMFYGNFKESTENLVKLPDKKLTEVIELLDCLLPYPSKAEINDENVNLMLQFADEYDIHDLKLRCETFLCAVVDNLNSSNASEILNVLFMASRYRLNNLLKICIRRTASLSSSTFKAQRSIYPVAVVAAVFEAKLNRHEVQSHKLSDIRKDPFFCSCRYCNATPSTRCIRCNQGVCADCLNKEPCTGFHTQGCPAKVDSVSAADRIEARTRVQEDQDCFCGYEFDDTYFT